jgi:hypothetical protein
VIKDGGITITFDVDAMGIDFQYQSSQVSMELSHLGDYQPTAPAIRRK